MQFNSDNETQGGGRSWKNKKSLRRLIPRLINTS